MNPLAERALGNEAHKGLVTRQWAVSVWVIPRFRMIGRDAQRPHLGFICVSQDSDFPVHVLGVQPSDQHYRLRR